MPGLSTEENAMAGRAVEFDHHSHDYAADPWSQYSKLRSECPVAWSEQYGGFWVVSRYEDVAAVARDDVTFSCR